MKYLRKSVAALLFIAICCETSVAQLIFNFKDKHISEIRNNEIASNSKQVTPSSTYMNPPGIADPVVFERQEATVPNLWVYYFPNAKDSTINNVMYEWDDSNFAPDHHSSPESPEVLNNYITKYKELLKQVSANYGKPETTGSIDDLSLIESGKFKRKDVFSKNGVDVEMYIVLSNKEITSGVVTISPTHRIRMYVKPTV
ncbi:hypothetical protein D0C36_00460 [Mucilaginibacter conchicola]|uniref:Uncharacterized protein n=1 Tax=Mucilaginibacter conchicola TaxID=2303333 RepID=A0A372NVA9_9SPHI|nr:hypothetical protein [Mucilaginibacter conchicola]RFZ94068.1 hypothetical protein D0C36_00460 [Mucilaginibacter conchicola]